MKFYPEYVAFPCIVIISRLAYISKGLYQLKKFWYETQIPV